MVRRGVVGKSSPVCWMGRPAGATPGLPARFRPDISFVMSHSRSSLERVPTVGTDEGRARMDPPTHMREVDATVPFLRVPVDHGSG